LLNVLGNSCKKMRMLRIAQAEELIDALDLEEVATGRGLNQEMGLGGHVILVGALTTKL
jgi:hypothetical protein